MGRADREEDYKDRLRMVAERKPLAGAPFTAHSVQPLEEDLPVCGNCGHDRLDLSGVSQTLGSSLKFRDRNGDMHDHDPNDCEGHWSCEKCGSVTRAPMELVCWCGWGSINDGDAFGSRKKWQEVPAN